MSASLSKYRKAFYASQRLFDLLRLDTFPIDPFLILTYKTGEPIYIKTLQEYNDQHSHPLKIKDAKCFYFPEKAYLIIYNSEMPKNRIRFSLIHELAHIVLNHLGDERTEICRGGGIKDRLYSILEGEANTFTGNFLAPPILIKEKLGGNTYNAELISSFFGLSEEAVCSYRYRDYNEWLKAVPAPYETSILIRCREHLFPKYCMSCGGLFYGKESRYCPVCGKSSFYDAFSSEVMKAMIYPSVLQDQYGRAIICPRCGNEIPFQDGVFCIICGAPIYNRCAQTEGRTDTGYDYSSPSCDPSRSLPGNARYCPYCGNETTYFQAGLLKPWEQEVKMAQERQKQSNEVMKDKADDPLWPIG